MEKNRFKSLFDNINCEVKLDFTLNIALLQKKLMDLAAEVINCLLQTFGKIKLTTKCTRLASALQIFENIPSKYSEIYDYDSPFNLVH